jgi:hypothetical protein
MKTSKTYYFKAKQKIKIKSNFFKSTLQCQIGEFGNASDGHGSSTSLYSPCFQWRSQDF